MKRIWPVLLITLTTFAQAGEKENNYLKQGPTSCSLYIKDRQDMDGYRYVSDVVWVAGFITAYNLAAPKTFSILADSDIDSAMLWLEIYCKENPLKDLADGMRALAIELYPKRYRTPKEAQKRQ